MRSGGKTLSLIEDPKTLSRSSTRLHALVRPEAVEDTNGTNSPTVPVRAEQIWPCIFSAVAAYRLIPDFTTHVMVWGSERLLRL
jgi:hypothetical protein